MADNFRNVSLKILDNRKVQVKVILENRTKEEDAYMAGAGGEMEAVQHPHLIERFEVTTDLHAPPYELVVWSRIE